jgi:hypothetical protein
VPALLVLLALGLLVLVLLQAASVTAATIAAAIGATLFWGRLIRHTPSGPAGGVHAARAVALCHRVYWS